MRKIFLSLLISILLFCGVANAQFFFYRYREHATDCTSLTDGKKYDICHELDDKTFYSCVPTAGDCSGSEWEILEANLRSDPSACTSGQYVTDIAQDGTLTCAQVAFSQLSGSATDSQVPNTITIDLASTATALAANGANCSAGQFPLGVDASGAVESCSTSLSGNASTATALAANGSNCSAGSGAGGVDASGAAESCTDYYSTLSELQTAVTSDFHNLGGTDDDVPEAADYSNLTGGDGIANSPTGTIITASTEASFLTDGGASSLTCGSSAQGKMQVMDSGILQYCDGATTSVIQYAALANSSGVATSATALAANGANCSAGNYPLGVDASGAVESCTADDDVPESGDFTNLSGTSPISVSAGAVSIANAAADGSTKGAASFDSTDFSASSGNISLGATPSVTTGFDIGGNSTAAGILKLLEDTDDGTNYLTFKTAARASNLDLIWNITTATCTGDGNGGSLTINGSNEIVCSADDGGAGGSGDVTDVGNCSTGACFTGSSGTTLTSTTSEIIDLATANTFIYQRNDAGSVTFMGKDNSDPADTIYDTAGAGAITVGSADVTSVTVVTDSTGTAEVVLPAGSIDSTEVLDETLGAGDISFVGTATATSGNILVADGTDFESVAMSGDVTIASNGATTIGADKVALTTDTTGNYVATVADGTGIDGTASGEGTTYTPTLDLTEINSTTIGDGSSASIPISFNVSGTDSSLTIGSAKATFSNDVSIEGGLILQDAGTLPEVNAIAGDSVATYNAWSGLFWEIAHGDTGSPITSAGPVVKISKTEEIAAATCGSNAVDNECNAALSVNSIGTATSGMQVNAISAGARTKSAKDGVAIWGVGRADSGASGLGTGAYLEGVSFATSGKAVGSELRVTNETGANVSFSTSGISDLSGLWITANSSGGHDVGAGLAFDDIGSSQFDVGIGFLAGSIKTTTFRDLSSSTTSISVEGSHTTALNIASSAGAIALNNNNLSGTGTYNLSGAVLRIPSSTSLPGTCSTGDAYMDTDATSGQRFYLCQSANTWVLQGDGAGGGSGDVTDVGNCSTGACFTGSSGTTLTSTTSEVLDIGTANTLIFQRNDAGSVTFTGADNSSPADTIYDTTGAGAITIGSADVTSITLTADGTGTGEVVLPNDSVGAAEVDFVGTATATSGNILVADGTDFESVAMSGDIAITSAGATSIGNDKVVDADLAITESYFLSVQSAKITGAFVVQTPGGGDASTQGAQIDAGDGNWRLLFDATTDEAAVWQFRIPDYWSAHSEVNIFYTMASATANEVDFEVAVMCISDGDSADIGSASFANVATASATVPGTAGFPDEVSVTVTDDSCAAGDMMFLYLSKDADDATNDDATGDTEVVGVEYEFTR